MDTTDKFTVYIRGIVNLTITNCDFINIDICITDCYGIQFNNCTFINSKIDLYGNCERAAFKNTYHENLNEDFQYCIYFHSTPTENYMYPYEERDSIPPKTYKKKFENKLKVEDFVKAKKALEHAPMPKTGLVAWDGYISKYSLDNVGYQLFETKCQYPTKEENEMITVSNDTPYSQERNHLSNRLHSLFYDKNRELEKTFGLRDDDPPKTVKDMVERITSGKFVVPKDADEEDDFDSPFYTIRWRDPELKEDRKGYKAAYDLLKKARDTTKDEILIKTPTEGLEALRTFENQTFN